MAEPAGTNGSSPTGALPTAGAVDRLPADILRQVSYSGTPSMQGVTQPDDYVVELAEPTRRMAAFEEMRYSDDGVSAALTAREQMVLSANWQLNPGSDSERDIQIKEFVEDNIYPFLSEILRHLCGAIQYGFGAIEPIYAWSEGPRARGIMRGTITKQTQKWGRRIYLQKVAHLRQRTVYTFRITPTGDLVAVEQYVWDGFSFRRNEIPPRKLIMWAYGRQGDDYWGVPPTRSAYKAWTFKKQLEALNALGVDRFGVGTPVVEAGQGWSDQDYVRMEKYISTWRVGSNAYLIHPSGGKITLMGPEGTMASQILEWVKYYNLAIAKVYLTQGSELGSTETGARALGEVMLEQSETIVQADCEDLANILNEQVVAPLVDWNFGEQENYPQFVPSQRVRASSSIGTVIGQLVTNRTLDWSPQDEQWLRDAMHLPAIDLDARMKEWLTSGSSRRPPGRPWQPAQQRPEQQQQERPRRGHQRPQTRPAGHRLELRTPLRLSAPAPSAPCHWLRTRTSSQPPLQRHPERRTAPRNSRSGRSKSSGRTL
jgi:hypothetical protein